MACKVIVLTDYVTDFFFWDSLSPFSNADPNPSVIIGYCGHGVMCHLHVIELRNGTHQRTQHINTQTWILGFS